MSKKQLGSRIDNDYGRCIMNILKKMVFMTILLAAAGNSWATGKLSPKFYLTSNSYLMVTAWITPTFEGPTPEVCKTVKVTPLKALKDMVGVTASTGPIQTEIIALQLVTVDPVYVSPGLAVNFYIQNTELNAQTIQVELLVEPPIAREVCGAKASGQVLMHDMNGDGLVPVGSPVSLNDNFKATSPEPGAMDR